LPSWLNGWKGGPKSPKAEAPREGSQRALSSLSTTSPIKVFFR
jgi:hypothetical protein